jgi:predicted nucleotidyltransferase
MNERDRHIIASLKQRILAACPQELRKMIVFGSRSRGEAAPDSDLDVAVLVTRRTPDLERRLDDIAYALMWDLDFRPIISLKIIAEADFLAGVQKGFSFYCNVAREGLAA